MHNHAYITYNDLQVECTTTEATTLTYKHFLQTLKISVRLSENETRLSKFRLSTCTLVYTYRITSPGDLTDQFPGLNVIGIEGLKLHHSLIRSLLELLVFIKTLL